ncbi:MAG: lactate utilization protein [Gammaproteobacteria bacterium]|nr:lactate utilization protein [Gammaproteobacteria bacterium]
MGATRERILGRIRDAVSDGRKGDWQAELDRRVERAPQLIRPKLPDDRFACFSEKLALGGGTCERLDTVSQIPEAITRFMKTNELKPELRAAPAFKGVAWCDELEVSFGNTRGDDLISVTPAFCAVTETGSVVLLSSEECPTSLNFLPDVHIVIVDMKQLVPHYEDVWEKLRVFAEVPRAINFITGPSKTADVEQTLQIGAHGPRRLHVFLVEDLNSDDPALI